MKIIIIGVFYPYRGGLSDMNEKLFETINNKGIHINAYTFKYLYPELLFPGKTQYSDIIKPEYLRFNRIIHSLNPINWIKIGLKLKREKADIIILKYWTPFLSPCLGTICRFAKNKKTKIISIVDNIIPHEKKLIDNILNKYFIGGTDKFICMSKNVEKDLKTLTNKKIDYAPHPVYNNFGDKIDRITAREFLNWDKNGKYILFFGLIRKYKGVGLLIEVMSDKRIRDRNIKLCIAGEFYDDIEPYKQKIKDLNLEDIIIIENKFINNEEVKYYFCASDITAQTYLSATQSGVTQISYNFDKPVIVTNVGGLAEVVSENTGYVVETNVESIVKAVIDFFDNEKNFEKGISKEKEKFSWDNLVSKIIDL